MVNEIWPYVLCGSSPPLYSADRVSIEVTEVNALALGLNFRVFSDEEPATVGKEESALGIVGVSVRL